MKNIFIVLLISAFGCTASTQPNTTSEEGQKAKYEVLSIADFKAKLAANNDIQLLDVRTSDECAGGIIEGANTLDYFNESFKDELAKLDKTEPLMLYCRSGNRSGKASKIAIDLGFQEIYDLEGGYNAWSNQ